MAVRILSAPDASLEALNQGLVDILGSRQRVPADLRAATPAAAAEALRSHPVYTLGLQQVAEGTDLARAELTGWRYLVPGIGGELSAAEVLTDRGGGYTFAGLNQGPFVAGTLAALDRARSAVTTGSFELRVLRIPALYVMALWLHGESGNRDVVIPMAPTHHLLEPGRAYEGGEFTSTLAPAASERLEFDDSPRSRG